MLYFHEERTNAGQLGCGLEAGPLHILSIGPSLQKYVEDIMILLTFSQFIPLVLAAIQRLLVQSSCSPPELNCLKNGKSEKRKTCLN